jgi:hypothetical protein
LKIRGWFWGLIKWQVWSPLAFLCSSFPIPPFEEGLRAFSFHFPLGTLRYAINKQTCLSGDLESSNIQQQQLLVRRRSESEKRENVDGSGVNFRDLLCPIDFVKWYFWVSMALWTSSEVRNNYLQYFPLRKREKISDDAFKC